MGKIENIEQLEAEIARLRSLTKEKESNIRQDIRNMREQLKPENIILNSLSSLTGININKNEFLKNGLAMGLSLVLQRLVFKTETNIEKKIYVWIDDIFDRVKNFINKFSSRGNVGSEIIEEEEEEEEEEDRI